MRWTFAAAIAATCMLTGPTQAGGPFGPLGLIANDTGGIIPWSPFADRHRHEIAADHCARYFKFAKITSVHRQYGDYIGFVCRFGPTRHAIIVTQTPPAVIMTK